MLTRYSFWTGLVGLATSVAVAASAMAADSARLATYRQDGETSYALSLTADMPNKEVDAVDVVVLFDTSASQQGAYRETAIESLKALIAGLRPSDRVQVVAVDLNARPLNKDFAAAADPAIAEALTALGQQAPLGTTDLGAALDAAVKQFEMAESGSRAIVYIGDGISMANLLDAPTLAPLVAKMQAARVPVSSYAVGPETDPQLLAVLANQTGGNVYIGEPMVWQDEAAGVTDARAREENIRNADVAGKALAGWSRAAVMWPSKAQVPDMLGQVYPTSIPPLRADRDTILVGRTPADLTAPVELTVQAAGADGKPVDLAWDAKPEASGPDHAFLVSLVDGAARDGGITLPTVGVAGLVEVARMKGAQSDQLTMMAQRAIASGDRAGALKIVQTVLKSDPGNVQARTVQNALEGAPAELPPAGFEPDTAIPGETVVSQPPVDPAAIPADGAIILNNDPVVSAAPLPPAEPGLLDRRGADGTFLDEVEQERRVFERVLETEVQNTVRDARERMANEPQIAIQDLKLALENVSRAANLDPTTRAELEDKLQIALREAVRQASLKDELDALRNEELAAAAEAKQLNAQLQQRIDRISQLMNRFNALMDERRYVEAEEVAAVVEELDPNGVTPRVAALWARHKRHDYLQQVARSARHNAAWDTMYQTELSAIPFPDNPPIVYPDASVWEELTKRRKGVYEVDLASEGEAERRIYSALRQPLREPMDFVEQPLRDVVTILSETYDIPIQFDTAALDAVAASPDVEVSIQISNVSLKSALELMLKNAGAEALTYIVDNEVLLITTLEEAETRLQVKVYPVADLVMPIENIGMMGGGGGMMGGGGGGMGGGGGGMGGGMGGGGMGGGMGGGGMGGGGGGMFAVADDVAAEAPKSEAAKPATAETPAVATPTAEAEPVKKAADGSASKAPPRVTGIEIDLSVTPEAFWSKHFSGKQEDLAVVRRAVKQLIKQEQYDHAVALIQAALANGQPQSWMYESLGISLELAGRPKSEIERAIMSACDFSKSPEELMLIARYLSHIGLDGRAVDVYQQVVKAAPLYYEAYTLGLRAAQRAKDHEGVRWATAGILKQAWPADQQAIRDAALRVAQATLEEMRAAGENDAADAFQTQLDDALVRDCVVKVSWSGDADIDLIVEEPSGTSCSLREPRSAGGGVVLGDAYANYEKEDAKAEGFSETYVCPQGFAGEYRVRVRKVWGDVVADRVTVDVYKNYRSKDQKHQRQYVPVGEDDSLVVFNLDQGRRNDPVEAQQLVATINRQEAISKAVLAQQVSSLDDPSLIPGRGNLDPLDLRRQLALARGGAVGFMPIVITLPEGTSVIAQAVVSADRRYVRISASPSFTGIGNVTTFTFAGSAEETGGGGTGGGGTGAGGGGTGF